MSEQRERLFEFRIEYKKHGSIENNYHYYMAHNAQEALDFQLEMIDHRHWNIELIKLEKNALTQINGLTKVKSFITKRLKLFIFSHL